MFEAEEKIFPSQVTGTMDVQIPAHISEKELTKKVLQEIIAGSVKSHPKEIEVIVDEVIDHIFSYDDPTFAEESPKTDDFVPNVNENIVEKFENLPSKIREDLEIEDVNVNYFFKKKLF